MNCLLDNSGSKPVRNYAYHSDHPRFPGSLEEQKRQFPNAVWFPNPTRVEQKTGKFQGAGGRLLGVLPNGDQIQEHVGVLVVIATSEESWNSETFRIDMDRVRRARYLISNRKPRRELEAVDITSRMVGEAE